MEGGGGDDDEEEEEDEDEDGGDERLDCLRWGGGGVGLAALGGGTFLCFWKPRQEKNGKSKSCLRATIDWFRDLGQREVTRDLSGCTLFLKKSNFLCKCAVRLVLLDLCL